MTARLLKLVDSGTIRVIDVVILTKNEDGTIDAAELSDVGELRELQTLRPSSRSYWPRKRADLGTCGRRPSHQQHGAQVAN
jgi:hypothetical protein